VVLVNPGAVTEDIFNTPSMNTVAVSVLAYNMGIPDISLTLNVIPVNESVIENNCPVGP